MSEHMRSRVRSLICSSAMSIVSNAIVCASDYHCVSVFDGGRLRPMDRWCVDALEVFKTESGFKFVLLAFLDCFTRWI